MRRMRTMIVVLALLALTASVVWAANPSVDGRIWWLDENQDTLWDPGWQGIAPIVIVEGEPTDPNESLISDGYDIGNVYIRSSDDNLTLFGGFEVYGPTATLNQLGSISFAFDTDRNSSTGGPVAPGSCPNVGGEYRHDYLSYRGTILQALYRWNGTGWEYHAPALAMHGADYEIAVPYAAMGLTQPQCLDIAAYFENRAADPDVSVCFTWCPENGGGEGCTPGYWRQPQHLHYWVDYSPGNLFSDTFGVDCSDWACQDKTLLDAVWARGGGENALMRHAVAALLNAANPDVSYEYTDVITKVWDAYDSGVFEWTKDLFKDQNELGCPLD